MKSIIVIFIVTAVALAGCGEKSGAASVSGTYVDKDGSKLVFDGGKVKALGTSTARETDFTVSGNTLKYKFPHGYPVEATIRGDGTFTTNYGYVYKKVD